jgi:hypothetical protein
MNTDTDTTQDPLAHLPEITEGAIEAMLFTIGSKYGHWGVSPVLWGEPGTAKSSMIADVADRCGLPMVTRFASIHDAVDFSGMPVVASGAVAQVPLQWAAELGKHERAVLFIDEISTASKTTQNALLGVILERTIGDMRLPLGCRIIAAGNPSSITVEGRELGPAQSNRLTHWQCRGGSVEQWTDYMDALVDLPPVTRCSVAQPRAAEREAYVLSRWSSAYAGAQTLVTSFMRSCAGEGALDVLHKCPSEDDANYGYAWPSRRSWEMFGRALAGARIAGLDSGQQLAIAAACLGKSAAGQLSTWLAYPDIPDPIAWLDGQVHFAHDDANPIRTQLALAGGVRVLAGMAKGLGREASPEFTRRAGHFAAFVDSIFSDRPDLATLALRMVAKDEKLKNLSSTTPALARSMITYLHSGMVELPSPGKAMTALDRSARNGRGSGRPR